MVTITFQELAEVLHKQSDYTALESAPTGHKPPLVGLGFEFDLDELRDAVISASHQTGAEEIVNDVERYPAELYAAVLRWAGGAKIIYDLGNDTVTLS